MDTNLFLLHVYLPFCDMHARYCCYVVVHGFKKILQIIVATSGNLGDKPRGFLNQKALYDDMTQGILIFVLYLVK